MVCNNIPSYRNIKGFRKLGFFKNLDANENNMLWENKTKTLVIPNMALGDAIIDVRVVCSNVNNIIL